MKTNRSVTNPSGVTIPEHPFSTHPLAVEHHSDGNGDYGLLEIHSSIDLPRNVEDATTREHLDLPNKLRPSIYGQNDWAHTQNKQKK